MKLWPLNPKTGARSSSLKTGHKPPSMAELVSRASASTDIEILVGRDGLAEVAKAEAAAKAEEAASQAKAAASEALGAVTDAASSEGGKAASTITQGAEEGAVQHPQVTMVPGTLDTDDTVGATAANASPAVATTSSAAPQGTNTATGEEAAAVETAATSLPRKLALEVEVFAIGSINVPYLMALIKSSFEQV